MTPLKWQNVHQHSGVGYKDAITFFPRTPLIDNFNLNSLISMNVSTFLKTDFMFVNDVMIYYDTYLFYTYSSFVPYKVCLITDGGHK